jgi:branched-chain amino acid transport system permease protein
MLGRQFWRWWWILPAVLLLIFPLVQRAPYYHHLGFMTFLYAAMASSWNIIGGYTGYKSLGHSVFYGLGAYLVALVAIHLGWHPFLAAPLAGLIVALVGALIGWVALRTRGAAFVIVTIAMVYIFQLLALNLKSITNGAPGLSQPLPPWPPDLVKVPFYYVMLLVMAITIFASGRIRKSKFGLGLLAIREDEGKAEAVGINTTLYKILAFSISVYFVGVAGGIYSYFITHIEPMFIFDIFVGVTMILMTILGGQGTLWGPVLGAFIMVPLSDLILFRFGSTQAHLAIFGALLLLFMLFLPQGILPSLANLWERRGSEKRSVFGDGQSARVSVGQEAVPPSDKASAVATHQLATDE